VQYDGFGTGVSRTITNFLDILWNPDYAVRIYAREVRSDEVIGNDASLRTRGSACGKYINR
jgi:hypothetical protein